MRSLERICIVAVAIMFVSAGAAMARGYNGNPILMPDTHNYTGAWPVTVTNSQFGNGTDCLTLTQNGKNGGQASLVAGNQKYQYGSFTVVDNIMVVTMQEPLYGQNGALLFVAHAERGTIGHGLYENAEGGSDFDKGNAAFGMKGSC